MSSLSETCTPPPITGLAPWREFCQPVFCVIALFIWIVIVYVAGPWSQPTDGYGCSTTEGKVRTIESALASYRTVNGHYPTQAQGLESLVTRPTGDPQPKRWSQLLKADSVMDPWDSKIQYRNPGTKNPSGFDIFSLGPDRIESADDIGNW